MCPPFPPMSTCTELWIASIDWPEVAVVANISNEVDFASELYYPVVSDFKFVSEVCECLQYAI